MAGWLLTVSVGNAIVVIFAEARLTDNMVGLSWHLLRSRSQTFFLGMRVMLGLFLKQLRLCPHELKFFANALAVYNDTQGAPFTRPKKMECSDKKVVG